MSKIRLGVQESHLRIFYDRKGDVLYISVGSPREAISKETGDDILIRMDPTTQEIVGFTILNFTERFSDVQEVGDSACGKKAVPVTARFQMMESIEL